MRPSAAFNLGDRTARKYRGKMASGYEAKRKKQIRWGEENAAGEDMLTGLRPQTGMDCPVGTGRFFYLYHQLSVATVTGVDSSEQMLAIAKGKLKNKKVPPSYVLQVGDARKLEGLSPSDVIVAVRFLDLIDEPSMQAAMRCFMKLAKRAIICTIRFGDKYVLKSNTAEHDRKKFLAMISRGGFKITGDVPIFEAGWHVLRMERR